MYNVSDFVIDYIPRYFRNMKKREQFYGGIHERFYRRENPWEKIPKQRRGVRSVLRGETCDGKVEGNSTEQ